MVQRVSAARCLVEGDRRRHRGVQRLRADRDPHRAVARRHQLRRQTRRARRRSSSVAGAASGPARPPASACASSAIVSPGSSATVAARATGTWKIAPMLARTAFGPYGSAQPGPSTTAGGAERERAAQHRADVAGVGDPVQVDGERAERRRRPALLVDGERARARAELGDVREHVGLDLGAAEPAAGGAVALERAPAGRVGGGAAGPPPRRRSGRCRRGRACARAGGGPSGVRCGW